MGSSQEEADAFAARVVAKGTPLLGEKELEHLGFRDLVSGGFVDGPCFRRGEAVYFPQGGEPAPGAEPAGVLFPEALEGGILLQDRCAAARGELERGAQLIPEPTVIGPPVVAAPERGDFFWREELARAEVGEVEEVRITGEDGEGLVGGIAIAGRAERTDLPPGEAGRGDDIDEAAGFGAE